MKTLHKKKSPACANKPGIETNLDNCTPVSLFGINDATANDLKQQIKSPARWRGPGIKKDVNRIQKQIYLCLISPYSQVIALVIFMGAVVCWRWLHG